MSAFKDHCSTQSPDYAAHRPGYPAALFDTLAALTRDDELAWDCATGNGQAARGLAGRYGQVVATDASRAQIAAAPPHPGIEFRVAPAEVSGLPDHCVDLVTVVQAAHGFDLPAPGIGMEANWSLDPLMGYFSTWSAVKAYRQAVGEDPLPAMREQLAAA